MNIKFTLTTPGKLYVDFDRDRKIAFDIIEKFIKNNNAKDFTLYALNLSEGEIFPNNDDFIKKINSYASHFKLCYFYNCNSEIHKAIALLPKEQTDNIIFKSYMYGLLNRTYFYISHDKNSSYKEKLPYKKHFIFQNGVGKSHRLKLYIDFIQNNIEDKAHISWLNINKIINETTANKILKTTGINILEKRILDVEHTGNAAQEDLSDFYGSSAIDIFGESVFDNSHCVFPTEKTWKPVIYKKVFLPLTSPNFFKWFKSEGFQLYDEIFDYSFDTIINNNERYKAFWLQIENISKMNISELQQKIQQTTVQEKLEYNSNLALRKNVVPKELEEYRFHTNLLHTKKLDR